MSKVQGLFFGLATLVLVAFATFFFTKDWLPPLKSDRLAIDHAIWATLAVTGAVFIATNLLLAWFGWRYADRPGAPAPAYWHDNPRLEWTWTLATAGIMFIFLFNALGLWAQITKAPPADALIVEVTAQQFAWNARLPGKDGVFGKTDPKLVDPGALNFIGLDKTDPNAADDIILPQNQLYLPAGRAVRVELRSLDVIHSFFLPNFRVKQDAMPGMTVETWFTPTQTGDFEIACAQHCGLGHYRMRGQVHIVAPDDFDKTVAAAIE
jgi:cytochrome c oxidase subunit 2